MAQEKGEEGGLGAGSKFREPRVALTVELPERARVSPGEARKALIDAIGRIPDTKLKDLRSGVLTVIA